MADEKDTLSTGMPRQAIPDSEKDQSWREETVDAILDDTSFGDGPRLHGWQREMSKWYRYVNGDIDEEDYSHVLRPYGDAQRSMPAKLKNYNIIKPTIEVLKGEYAKRPDNYAVTVANPDVNTIKEREKKKKVLSSLREHFLQEIQEVGLVPNTEPQQVRQGEGPKLPEEIAEDFEREYSDARAIQGQNVLDYLEGTQHVREEYRTGWEDFIIGGMVMTLKEVVGGEIRYEILNPLNVDFKKSQDTKYVEDGQWAVVRKRVTPSSVVDAFYDVLTEEEIKEIEDPEKVNTHDSFITRQGVDDIDRGDENDFSTAHRDESQSGLINVYRVFWKSLKKIGIVRYIDEWGERQKKEVDGDYKPSDNEKVDWFWINEVWEGTRIGRNIHKRIRPAPIQRGELDNPSKCKLPVNGRIYSDRNAPFVSMVSIGVPYQLVYNIYKYRLETTIAKAKGMIAQIDIDTIPEDWDIETWLYYMDAVGISFTQNSKEGGQAFNNTHRQVLDLTAKAIEQFIAILEYTNKEWESVSGVSRQRKGQMSQYDLKGTSERSIIQSSHITEDLFKKFEEFKERERAGILDYSRIAFVNGKKGMYVLDDATQGWLDLDGLQHMESEYGVHVTGSAKEQQNINLLKSLGQQMVQAGWSPNLIAEIMETDSMAGLKEKLREGEKIQRKLAQKQRQAEQQLKQQELRDKERERQHKSEENEKDRQNDLKIAMIKEDGEGDTDDVGRLFEERMEEKEQRRKDEELRHKKKVDHEKLDLERKKVSQSNNNS